jgi:hypothetical protein
VKRANARGFAIGIKLIAKPSVLKTQAKPRRFAGAGESADLPLHRFPFRGSTEGDLGHDLAEGA